MWPHIVMAVVNLSHFEGWFIYQANRLMDMNPDFFHRWFWAMKVFLAVWFMWYIVRYSMNKSKQAQNSKEVNQ
jgi:hypothetical protein